MGANLLATFTAFENVAFAAHATAAAVPGRVDARSTGTRVLDLIDALRTEFSLAQVTATHNPEVATRSERAVGLADGRITASELRT